VIEAKDLTHHEQTSRLWEGIGETRVETPLDGIEQRKRPRFLVADAACRLDVLGANDDENIEAVICDVCADGACLLSSAPLSVGQSVRLHPPAAVRTELDAVDGCVVFCRKRSGRFRIGVRFSPVHSPASPERAG
jgi:hypothetical protein